MYKQQKTLSLMHLGLAAKFDYIQALRMYNGQPDLEETGNSNNIKYNWFVYG